MDKGLSALGVPQLPASPLTLHQGLYRSTLDPAGIPPPDPL